MGACQWAADASAWALAEHDCASALRTWQACAISVQEVRLRARCVSEVTSTEVVYDLPPRDPFLQVKR